jgi:large subunit ribosomal protein L4
VELNVFNMDGEKVDAVDVDEALFGPPRPAALRQVLLAYEANRRSGTAAARNRVDKHGTRSKPFRQKGTGRARQGSWLSPHHVGGGVAHGPNPRSYRQRLPRTTKKAALLTAYRDRLANATRVVDQIKLDRPRTGEVARMLKNLGVGDTCLIATFGRPANLARSARNIPGVVVKPVREINAHDLIRPAHLVITRRALDSIIDTLAGEKAGGAVRQ